MAIAVRPDGTIEVETVEQAVELSKRLTNGSVNGSAAPRVAAAKPPNGGAVSRSSRATGGWEGFLAIARTKPMKLAALSAIRAKGEITLEELRDAIGVKTNNEVGGVMAGISKNLKAAHVKGALVLTKERDGRPPNGTLRYKAGPMLLDAPELK